MSKRSPNALETLRAAFVDPELCPECGQTIFRHRRGPNVGKIRPHLTPAGIQAKRIGPESYCTIDGGREHRRRQAERKRSGSGLYDDPT